MRHLFAAFSIIMLALVPAMACAEIELLSRLTQTTANIDPIGEGNSQENQSIYHLSTIEGYVDIADSVALSTSFDWPLGFASSAAATGTRQETLSQAAGSYSLSGSMSFAAAADWPYRGEEYVTPLPFTWGNSVVITQLLFDVVNTAAQYTIELNNVFVAESGWVNGGVSCRLTRLGNPPVAVDNITFYETSSFDSTRVSMGDLEPGSYEFRFEGSIGAEDGQHFYTESAAASGTASFAFDLVGQPGGITRPAQGELVVTSVEDTIRWVLPEEYGLLDVELNIDVVDEPDAWQFLGLAAAADNMFVYTPADLILSNDCQIRLISAGGDTVTSKIFKIKPLTITKLNEDDDFFPWVITANSWPQINVADNWWPQSWWEDFDYVLGTDPNTDSVYPTFLSPAGYAFATANSSDFPDWPLFVQTFGADECYWSPSLGIYSLNAVSLWKAMRGTWGGSCHGLSSSALVNFFDPEYLRQRFPALAPYDNLPQETPAPDEVRKLPNQFNNAQRGLLEWAYMDFAYSNMTPRQTVRLLEAILAKDTTDGLPPLHFQNQGAGGGAHAVVPLRITFTPPGGGVADSTWTITTYDPNLGATLHPVRVFTSPGNLAGSWNVLMGGVFWSGVGKGLYLPLPPDSTYGENTQLPLPVQVTAKDAGRTQPAPLAIFTSARGELALTSGSQGGVAGFVGNQLADSLPGVTPWVEPTGRPGPPSAYAVDPDAGSYAYTVAMGEGDDARRTLGVFRGDAGVLFDRAPGAGAQTDRLHVTGGVESEGLAPLHLTAVGTSVAPQTIALTALATESDHEKAWLVGELQLAVGDSLGVGRSAPDELAVLNGGPAARTCTIALELASADLNPRFEAADVTLPAGSTVNLVADWANLAEAPLTLEIDLGSDGTVDEVVQVANQAGGETGVQDRPGSRPPRQTGLLTPSPNPFNPQVEIAFALAAAGPVEVTVYDVTGRKVATLAAQAYAAGDHRVTWEGRDASGRSMPSGTYLVRLVADGRVDSRKVQLVR